MEHDREIINRFVAHLNRHGWSDLKVDRWPEDDSPGQSEIDAIAGPFAIEHTSIDTVPNQWTDNDWFGEVFDPLEAIVSPLLPFRLRVHVPRNLICRGRDWQMVQRSTLNCIVSSLALPEGEHYFQIAGSVNECRVVKTSDGGPGLFFYRAAGDDTSLPERLGKQVARKLSKLDRYRVRGYTTILLLESRDGSTMNQGKMLKAARSGLGALPSAVAQLWYVEAPRGMAADFFNFTTDV